MSSDPDWVERAARAATDLAPSGAADLVVQQVITVSASPGDDVATTPGGTVRAVAAYHLCLGPDGVRVEPGYASGPHVTISEDLETALAIRRGEISAQAAFMHGSLRVEGDLQRLAAHGRALADRPRSGADPGGPTDPDGGSR